MSTKQEHTLTYVKGGEKIDENFNFDIFVKYIQHFKTKTKKKFQINEDENLNDHVVFEVNETKVKMEDLINEMKNVIKDGKSIKLTVRNYSHLEIVNRCVITSEKSLDIDSLSPWSVIGTVRVDETKLGYTKPEFERTITFGNQMADPLGGLREKPLKSNFPESGFPSLSTCIHITTRSNHRDIQ